MSSTGTQYENIINIEECQKIIENSISSKDHELLDYNVKKFDGATGFQGEYFRILILIKQNNEEKRICLFAKATTNTNEVLADLALKGWEKEEFVYCTFFKALADNGLSALLDFSAKCYFARYHEILVLDDLSQTGYFGVDPMKPAKYDVIDITIRKLAKFHACSILLEEKKSREEERIFRISDEYGQFLRPAEGEVHKCGGRMVYEYIIDTFPEIPKKITVNEFKKKTKIAMDALFGKHFNPSNEYRNVINHGDSWLNNVLIKKDDAGRAVSGRLIDFQMAKICPPVLDVLLLIYTGTDKTSRKKYMNEWLENYYNELSNILNTHGILIEDIFDYPIYIKMSNEYKPAAICQSLCFAQLIFVPQEKLTTLNADKDKSNHFFIEDRRTFFEQENILDCEPVGTRIQELLEDLCKIFENEI